MSLARRSVSRPVTVTMVTVAIVVFGVVGFGRLSVDLLPELSYPTITIRTEMGNAAPVEVENLLSRAVEQAVGVVNNVQRVTSVSRTGVSEVLVEFGWGTRMDFAAMDVREKLEMLDLPDAAGRPVVLRYDPGLEPVLRVALTGVDDLFMLRDLAEDDLRRNIETVDGVAAVEVRGGLEEEILVEVDPLRLSQLGLGAEDLAGRIAAENVNVTGGSLEEGETEFLVRTLAEVVRLEDLRKIPIRPGSGAVLKLGDLATVKRSSKDRDLIIHVNGREGLELAVYKEAGANTVGVVTAIRKRLSQLESSLKQRFGGLHVITISDQSKFIRQAIDEVLGAAWKGGLLAVAILYLFLGSARPTLVIGLVIPISIVASFLMMFLAGVSINIMSLGGLALGVGMLVDNAIVVIEAIHRRWETAPEEIAAERAAAGAEEVGSALFASTLTTVAVFVPVLFVTGIAGQLFVDQALTVSFSLLASLVAALTLIPMLSGIEVVKAIPAMEGDKEGGWLARGAERLLTLILGAIGWLVAMPLKLLRLILAPARWIVQSAILGLQWAYPVLLGWALRWRFIVLLGAILLLWATARIAPSLGRELLPEMSQGQFVAHLELTPGTSLETTERLSGRLEREIGELAGVDSVVALVGASSSGGAAGQQIRENLARLYIRLGPGIRGSAELQVMALVRGLLAHKPGLEARLERPSALSTRVPLELEIRGRHLPTLARVAEDLAERIRGIPGLTDVETSAEGGIPEVQILPDRQKLRRLGLDVRTIADRLGGAIEGEIATEIWRGDRKIPVRVRARREDRHDASDVSNLPVADSNGIPILAESVADLRLGLGPVEILRANLERLHKVGASVTGRPYSEVLADVEEVVAETSPSPGVRITIAGQSDDLAASLQSLLFAAGLALFLVYLVMASQFESFLLPLVIIVSVPLALVSVVAVLWATSTPVSVVALLGVILLSGIIVNNAILLADKSVRLRREGRGRDEALIEAGTVRLRPILMTTATTVLGLLPMAVGLGDGAELRAPMAFVVIGGLVGGTILTLVVIPCLLRVIDWKTGGHKA